MNIVKRKSKRAEYGAGDKVRTSNGEGIINYVFPRGPHGKRAYSVKFANKRVGVIFDEYEISRIEKGSSM